MTTVWRAIEAGSGLAVSGDGPTRHCFDAMMVHGSTGQGLFHAPDRPWIERQSVGLLAANAEDCIRQRWINGDFQKCIEVIPLEAIKLQKIVVEQL